jgi:RelA/SpoT family (p)ppGpp synthetase
MIKQSKPFEEIYDLSAIRIILDTEDVNECYTTLGIVNGIYIPIPDRFKDYIAIPKTNNYRSLHTTVIGPTGQRVEVQIRTRKMHEIAEQGVAAHWKYKEGKVHIDETITQYVQWIREILDNTGNEELKRTIVDNFRLDLYSDEVYVFTPKGDLKRLPIKSTPVDFAFAIHSDVGHHCIGAKVNKRIVPLDTKLNRGDQVEILTSKNQHPNKNWLKFVQTHKANSEIRKYLNKEDENLVESGKDIFNKKAKKLKVSLSSQDIDKLAKQLKFENSRIFYRALAQGTFNVDDAFIQQKKIQQEENTKAPEEEIEVFTRQARSEGGELIIDGEQFKVLISYSKCCNPIPGDPVAGYITTGEGIKIHRKDCKTLIEIAKREPEKIVSVQWPQMDDSSFLVGLHINGEDRAGMLNEIANSIVSYDNTSIKSINIDTAESIFNGIVTLYVNNLEHLSKITDRLKKIKGIFSVKRLESN